MGTVLTIIVGIGSVALLLILLWVAFLVGTFVYCTPYGLCLAAYIQKNNLPKDYRRSKGPREAVRNATQYYSDLLHHRKPTFD